MVTESLWVNLLDQGRFQTNVMAMSQGRPFKFRVGFLLFFFSPVSDFSKNFSRLGSRNTSAFLDRASPPRPQTLGARSLRGLLYCQSRWAWGEAASGMGHTGSGASTRAACAVLTGVWSVVFHRPTLVACSSHVPICPPRPLHPPPGSIPREVFPQNFPFSSHLYFARLHFPHRFFFLLIM